MLFARINGKFFIYTIIDNVMEPIHWVNYIIAIFRLIEMIIFYLIYENQIRSPKVS